MSVSPTFLDEEVYALIAHILKFHPSHPNTTFAEAFWRKGGTPIVQCCRDTSAARRLILTAI